MQCRDDFAPGAVWLVGAGPGDPELLTGKALRLLGQADIIFYDALVGQQILALASEGVECVNVGKRSGRHSQDQISINAKLVSAALLGKRVVRLKGGDPSIFGRSAEEMSDLRAAGIDVRICPGVTTASAAAANAGASLTLRGSSQGVTFLTAHARAGEALSFDRMLPTCTRTTLAVYMGRSAAAAISLALIAGGWSADTPILVAVNVSLPSERLIRGRLSALAFLVRAISDDDPTLLLIGEAVASGGATRPSALALSTC